MSFSKALMSAPKIHLLTVEDCFLIKKLGLVLVPDFQIPHDWKDRTETVSVTTPDGNEYDTIAQFNMSHFQIREAVPSDHRWRVVVVLPDREKDDVPIGSKISVTEEIHDALGLLG